MSYDLFLKPADGSAATPAMLRSWLAARPHYLLGEAAGLNGTTGARYGHEDTGVTFTLDLAPAGPDGAAAGNEHGDDTLAAFGVDLLVPAFFAETAAAELTALCGEFDLLAEDPQTGTAGRFDADAFLTAWRSTAELAARHAAASGNTPPTAPAASLEAAHKWNAARARWRTRMPEDGPGVPRVQLRLARSPTGNPAVRTWCAWVDAAPIVLPPCDDVLLVRDATRPRRLLIFKTADASLCLVPRSSVVKPAGGDGGAPGFGPAPERFPPGTRQLLEPTKATAAWFAAPPPDAAPPEAVPPRAVIEAERLAAAVER